MKMTKAEAKRIYISAGGPKDHDRETWNDIHVEMVAVVEAKSDRAAGKIIEWWDCWRPDRTATAFARRVRKAWEKEARP